MCSCMSNQDRKFTLYLDVDDNQILIKLEQMAGLKLYSLHRFVDGNSLISIISVAVFLSHTNIYRLAVSLSIHLARINHSER